VSSKIMIYSFSFMEGDLCAVLLYSKKIKEGFIFIKKKDFPPFGSRNA